MNEWLFITRFICRVRQYERNPSAFSLEHYEAWYNVNVWGPVIMMILQMLTLFSNLVNYNLLFLDNKRITIYTRNTENHMKKNKLKRMESSAGICQNYKYEISELQRYPMRFLIYWLTSSTNLLKLEERWEIIV